MRIRRVSIIGFFAIISVYSPIVYGQSRLDSLHSMLDKNKPSDTAYINACIEFCDLAVSTDFECLIPDYSIKALRADSAITQKESITALRDRLANYYIRTLNLEEAASQFDKMRLQGETWGDTHALILGYKGLGTVYYMLNDYEKARNYYQKGLSLCAKDSDLYARLCNNIGNTFKMQNQSDSVWAYYNQSISYHKAHQNYQQLSVGYCNLAVFLSSQGNIRETKKYLDLALQTAIQAQDPVRENVVYGIMGNLYFKQDPALSKKCYEKSLTLARKYHNYERVANALINLSDHAEQSGDYKQALAYHEELRQLDDSLDLVQKKTRLKQLETDHILSLKSLEEMKEAQKQEVETIKNESRQKMVIVLLSVAFLTLLAILLVSIRYYQMKIKIGQTKEKFFSMIAHDVKNPFSGILGLAEVLDDYAQSNSDPVRRKQMGSLHHSLNKVYELLENLLQWSQAESGKMAFNPTIQLLSPLVSEVISLLIESGVQKGIAIENQIQTGLTARFDSNMLHTIIRNLISNAIKFSRENGTVFISAEIQNKEVVIKVKDQGIGIESNKIDCLFSPREHISTKGTQNETGTGLGLLLCKEFVNRHGGKIWVESKKDEGTTVSFTLPD